MATLRGRRGAALGLSALFALSVVLVGSSGARVHSLQNDELIAVNGGAWLARHFPSGLFDWHHISGRGFERLAAFVSSLGHAVAPDAASAFVIEHWLMAAVWSSSAIWAYLLAREVGVERLGALAAAAMTAFATWRVLGTSFLNSTPAYATVVLAVWLVVRTAARPSVLNDVLALLALLLVALGRTGNLLVAVILPVAVVAGALAARAPGEGRPHALGRIPGRHPVVTAATVGALAVYLKLGAQKIVSGYDVHGTTWSFFWGRLQVVVAQLGQGLLIVPAAVGGAWLVSGLVRDRPAPVRIFAPVAIVAFFALVYASALAGAEERYVAPAAPILIVAFVAAVQRREVGLVSSLVAVVVVARAIAIQAPITDPSPYQFFVSAGQQSFSRLIVQRGSVDLPVGGHHVVLLVTIACLAVAAALALTKGRRAGRWVAVTAILIPLTWSVTAGAYNTRKFVDGAGLTTVTWKQRAFVDQIAGDRFVGGLEYDPTFAGQMQPFWREIMAFNRQLQETVGYGYQGTLVCCGNDVRVARIWGDRDSGHIRTTGRIPQLLVWLPRFAPFGLDADVIGGETYLPMPAQVLRLNGAPRMSYSVRGATKTGDVMQGRPVRFRVFTPVRRAQTTCLVVRMAAASGSAGKPPRRYAMRWAGGSRDGALTAEVEAITIPLPGIATRPYEDVRLVVRSSERLDRDQPVAVIATTDRVSCPTGTP